MRLSEESPGWSSVYSGGNGMDRDPSAILIGPLKDDIVFQDFSRRNLPPAGLREEIWRQKRNSQTKTFVQVSTVLNLAVAPVGLPDSACVSYLPAYRPSRDLAVIAHIQWNPVYSGLGGASGGFGCPHLS